MANLVMTTITLGGLIWFVLFLILIGVLDKRRGIQ